MLRNRIQTVTSKQALMADHSSQSSPTQNYTRPITSFFNSPRFKAFTTKSLFETEGLMSPTSILDTYKPFFPFGNNHFWNGISRSKSPKFPQENKRLWDKLGTKGVGLALVDTFNDKSSIEENNINSTEAINNKMVLFGAKLRVQIPPLPPSTISPTEYPESPADFGTKTRNSIKLPGFWPANSGIQTEESPRCLSVTEMELSEDYTCVIYHGPNPKTTHIFDNCIVESYYSLSDKPNSATDNFLSFCYTCKKNLDQKDDIYIYRGEKAFCSCECRYQEMLLDGEEN